MRQVLRNIQYNDIVGIIFQYSIASMTHAGNMSTLRCRAAMQALRCDPASPQHPTASDGPARRARIS